MEGMKFKSNIKTPGLEELPLISETLFVKGLQWLKDKYGTINDMAFKDDYMRLNMKEYATDDKSTKEAKRIIELINIFTGEKTVELWLNTAMYKGPRYMLRLVSEQSKKLAA